MTAIARPEGDDREADGAGQGTFKHGYALVIGVDQNAVTSWSLPAVTHDVLALRETLVDPRRCGYPEGNVRVLTGKDATRSKIEQELERLRGCIERDSEATAVVYFSGHGHRVWSPGTGKQEYFLLPYDVRAIDSNGQLVPNTETALPAVVFARKIEEIEPQRLLVVLDCCHAGGMGAIRYFN